MFSALQHRLNNRTGEKLMSSIYATGSGTGTAAAGAVTLNNKFGRITSEALVTAAGATYTLTITNANILATDVVLGSVALGTATTGSPNINTIKAANGSLVIIVQNVHASAALNGTIIVSFAAFGV